MAEIIQLNKELGVSKWVELARERQARDLVDAPKRGFHWRPELGWRVVKFFSLVQHYKGDVAGQPFELEDWQIYDVILPLFSWVDSDGYRRFREAWLEWARKQGKTAFAAVIGLYLTAADGEAGAEVYTLATKKEQAKIVWDDADIMATNSPYLSPFVQHFKTSLFIPRTQSSMKYLGRNSKSTDGLNPHGYIADEVHEWTDRMLWDKMTTATGFRKQPLGVAITTAGVYRPEAIGWIQHERAQAVLEGVIEDDTLFALIAAAEPDDDFSLPSTWAKANPNMGVSISPKYLAQQYQKAINEPGFYNTFARLHLNIWVQQVDRVIDIPVWNDAPKLAKPESLVGQLAYGGLDLATTVDLASFELVFPDPEGAEHPYDVLSMFWCPEKTISERTEKDRVPYTDWAREGLIRPTPGDTIDHEVILRDVLEACELYNVEEIGFDPFNAMQLVKRLSDAGLKMVPVRQGFLTMSPATKQILIDYKQKKIAHGGHKILTWNASNVALERDAADNIKFSKKESTEKIDGMIALTIARERSMSAEAPYVPDGNLVLL